MHAPTAGGGQPAEAPRDWRRPRTLPAQGSGFCVPLDLSFLAPTRRFGLLVLDGHGRGAIADCFCCRRLALKARRLAALVSSYPCCPSCLSSRPSHPRLEVGAGTMKQSSKVTCSRRSSCIAAVCGADRALVGGMGNLGPTEAGVK